MTDFPSSQYLEMKRFKERSTYVKPVTENGLKEGKFYVVSSRTENIKRLLLSAVYFLLMLEISVKLNLILSEFIQHATQSEML